MDQQTPVPRQLAALTDMLPREGVGPSATAFRDA